MHPRPGPHDLRASDVDRDLVISLLSEAAGDGRLTMPEHAERSERALSARTLGELASLTSDLAVPSGQPIRLYSRRAVTAICAKERRDGRWVVPDSFPVTAVGGDVVLDLRNAVLASQRTLIYATAIGGQIKLIVPPGIAVEMTGRSFLGMRSVSGRGQPRPGPAPAQGVIEVRTLAVGGRVRVITPRKSRWRRARG